MSKNRPEGSHLQRKWYNLLAMILLTYNAQTSGKQEQRVQVSAG